MAKKVLIILAEGFEDIEATTAIDILRRAEVTVTVAGLDSLKVKGSRGVVIIPDEKLDDAGSDYDAIVLPGGLPGATNLAASKKVTSLIQALHQKGKIVAAICASPAIVLAPTGVLNGKSATCYPGMQEKFTQDTTYKTDRVVVDENIITSQGPGTALAFALAIVERLCGKKTRDTIANATLFC